MKFRQKTELHKREVVLSSSLVEVEVGVGVEVEVEVTRPQK